MYHNINIIEKKFISNFHIIQNRAKTDQNVKKQTKTDFALKDELWREKETVWAPV